MSELIDDLDGIEVMVDDILVWGTTQEEHDKRLEKVLERAERRNPKLNKDKSQISKPAIHYLGHVLTKEGIKPDPPKGHCRWTNQKTKMACTASWAW
jgi:hypothetical protein